MRPLQLVLGLSLLANLGLAIVCFRPRADEDITNSAPTGRAVSNVVATRTATASETMHNLPALITRLETGDLATELAALRRLGLPEDTLKTLAEGVIMRRFREGMTALNKENNLNYWQGGYALTKNQRERQKEMMRLIRDLGDQARLAGIQWDMFDYTGYDRVLSDDKSQLVARIKQDREEMRAQIYMEASGLMLERDRERLRFIDEEYQKDLAAALSPQELMEWNLRNSNTANQLRSQLAYMNPTEEEFRKVYQLQAEFEKNWTGENRTDIDWGKRNEAQKALKTEIAGVLGPERYADYTKSTDHEFGTLSNLEYRLELPDGTADRLYAMHAESNAAATAIRENKQLSKDDQTAALKALAAKITNEMSAALGEEGFNAYKNQSGRWIDALSR